MRTKGCFHNENCHNENGHNENVRKYHLGSDHKSNGIVDYVSYPRAT